MSLIFHLGPKFLFFFINKELISNRFNKVTRHGRRLGKRTIAGKVVSESYGAARQQHTFTVGDYRLMNLCTLNT